MMTAPNIKEVCAHCQRNISLSQVISECIVCDCVIHSKCFNKNKHTLLDGEFYCENCKHLASKQYNPFKQDFENDELDENDVLFNFAQKMESCKAHKVEDINNSYSDLLMEHVSILFQNIDGNKSNFDTLAASLKRFTKKFSIIGIAETNICPELGDIYQLTDYIPKYQEKIANKSKGSGLALYIHESMNATINSDLSQVTENLETLFVSLSGSNPTTVGVLYRPPNGNYEIALQELKNILEKAPKETHIAGDFNIDLHSDNSKLIQYYENVIFSKGFFPTISTVTHEKPGCKPSCIDNIITNAIENIIISGTIPNPVSHHHQIFQIFESTTHKSNCKAKQTQYYDYCNSNVEKFVECLGKDLGKNDIDNFTTFINIFNENLDKTCKLKTPKCSKRTVQNNPWISSGLIVAINHCDDLYDNWYKARKKKCKHGESDNRGGTCLCDICSIKRYSYNQYKEYRKKLKSVKKSAKQKYYTGKFDEKSGDIKKTWEIINNIHGKNKQQIKPLFIINNEKITNRRMIANEFNKYFVSLASNLNSACNELGEVIIADIPSFSDYLPKTNCSSIYLHHCTPEEIHDIIHELQNGKSSDIPIHVIKQSASIISPRICALYNKCMYNGIFPDELKTGRITIYPNEMVKICF